MNTNADTGDSELIEAENTSAAITQILVTLCLSVVDVDGDDSGINDVTNPANYLLFSQG
ncbi:MAG: hypothetical protein ACI9I4_001391, partial [Neolewinella sp.]